MCSGLSYPRTGIEEKKSQKKKRKKKKKEQAREHLSRTYVFHWLRCIVVLKLTKGSFPRNHIHTLMQTSECTIAIYHLIWLIAI